MTTTEFERISHTYAFLKTGAGNRYLKYARDWGGFYVGFENFPIELLAHGFDDAVAVHAALKEVPERTYFHALREIYLTSLPLWREKVRFAVWDRSHSQLEIWQAIDELQPFPRKFMPTLFDDCKTEHELPSSKEWQNHLKYIERHFKSDDFDEQCDFVAGPSGCRFLPARPICAPIPSESLYTPIDTLSVLQQLNRRTFAYMTNINPPGVPWPDSVFDRHTAFDGPDGLREESGYGRFVREYLDRIVDPASNNSLGSLSHEQRMRLVCATVNPLLVETAAMLFALDIGMVIDSGRGKGRHGIDVIAACPRDSSPSVVLERLETLGISLPKASTDHLRESRTLSFQCKGYDGLAPELAARLVEFRPFSPSDAPARGIPLFKVLQLACEPQRTGLRHLNAWLDRMCEIVVPAAARR